MYMYEEVAVRLWDRGLTEGDAKALYRDCHKGPIPHIRNKMVFYIASDSSHIIYEAQPSMDHRHF